MNNKGQSLGISVMASVFLIIVGFTLLNFFTPEIDNARINLSCSSPSTISDGTKLLCLATDAAVPYFIVLILSLVIGTVTERFVF